MNEHDLHRELLEHADGREASAELQRALRESPQLRLELEQARKHARFLKESLGALKPEGARAEALREAIMADLPARDGSLWWAAAAVAAAIVVAVAGTSAYWLAGNEPGRSTKIASDSKPAPKLAKQWQVERFVPAMAEVPNTVVRTEQKLSSGDSIDIGKQEYARITESGGATWLAYPGTQLSANGALKLKRGAVELTGLRGEQAELEVAGKNYVSQSRFLIAVDGAATSITVYDDGGVTQSDSAERKKLSKGRHGSGASAELVHLESRAAYVKGFEAWREQNWKAAIANFARAAQSGESEEARRNAHFYWFAAAGRDGSWNEAVSIGESFLRKYPQDDSLDYVHLFLGKYCIEGQDQERARAYLMKVVASSNSSLRDAAQSMLDHMGGSKARAQGAAWDQFHEAWQRQDFAKAETILRGLLKDSGDPGVQSGEALFWLGACVGNQNRHEDAIALIDELLAKHPGFRSNDYALYFKAVYLSQLGKREGALAALDQLERNYPDSSMKVYANDLRKSLK